MTLSSGAQDAGDDRGGVCSSAGLVATPLSAGCRSSRAAPAGQFVAATASWVRKLSRWSRSRPMCATSVRLGSCVGGRAQNRSIPTCDPAAQSAVRQGSPRGSCVSRGAGGQTGDRAIAMSVISRRRAASPRSSRVIRSTSPGDGSGHAIGWRPVSRDGSTGVKSARARAPRCAWSAHWMRAIGSRATNSSFTPRHGLRDALGALRPEVVLGAVRARLTARRFAGSNCARYQSRSRSGWRWVKSSVSFGRETETSGCVPCGEQAARAVLHGTDDDERRQAAHRIVRSVLRRSSLVTVTGSHGGSHRPVREGLAGHLTQPLHVGLQRLAEAVDLHLAQLRPQQLLTLGDAVG